MWMVKILPQHLTRLIGIFISGITYNKQCNKDKNDLILLSIYPIENELNCGNCHENL